MKQLMLIQLCNILVYKQMYSSLLDNIYDIVMYVNIFVMLIQLYSYIHDKAIM